MVLQLQEHGWDVACGYASSSYRPDRSYCFEWEVNANETMPMKDRSLCLVLTYMHMCLSCCCAMLCRVCAACSWVAPSWLEWVSRRLRVAVGYPKGRYCTLMPCK